MRVDLPGPDYYYQNAHEGKRAFKTTDQARHAAKQFRKEYKVKTVPYLCSVCRMYHTGHKRKLPALRRKRRALLDKT